MSAIEYRGYTIQEDYRNPYSNKPEFMYYPTNEGIQHDGDLVGESYKYCGNCKWESSLESAKAEINNDMSVESLLINGVSYEIEVLPFLGEGSNFYCAMWQMDGVSRLHCYDIRYGDTETEAREAMDRSIFQLEQKNKI